MGTPSAARIIPHLSPSKPPSLKGPADRNVHYVVLGNLQFKPWYPSFYPEELVGKEVDKLYVCQWCFKYSKDVLPFQEHVVSRLWFLIFVVRFIADSSYRKCVLACLRLRQGP